MMKKMRILLYLILFWGLVVDAGNFAVGPDVAETAADSGTAAKISDPHIRAMEYYISGLLEKDPARKTDLFYRAVSLDPGRRLPVLLLVGSLEKSPGDAGRVYQLLQHNVITNYITLSIFFFPTTDRIRVSKSSCCRNVLCCCKHICSVILCSTTISRMVKCKFVFSCGKSTDSVIHQLRSAEGDSTICKYIVHTNR